MNLICLTNKSKALIELPASPAPMQCGKKQTKASLLSVASHSETLSQNKQEQEFLIAMENQTKHKNLLIYLIIYDTLLTLSKSSVFIRAANLHSLINHVLRKEKTTHKMKGNQDESIYKKRAVCKPF